MIPDIGPRDFNDRMARYSGGRSLKEARKTDLIRTYKRSEVLRKKQLKESMDLVLDRVLETGEVPQSVLDKWENRGGNKKQLKDALIGYYKDRAQTYALRELGQIKGLSGAQKAQRLQEFNMLIDSVDTQEGLLEILKELK